MSNLALAGAGGTGVGVRISPPSANSSASAAELPAEGSLLAGALGCMGAHCSGVLWLCWATDLQGKCQRQWDTSQLCDQSAVLLCFGDLGPFLDDLFLKRKIHSDLQGFWVSSRCAFLSALLPCWAWSSCITLTSAGPFFFFFVYSPCLAIREEEQGGIQSCGSVQT